MAGSGRKAPGAPLSKKQFSKSPSLNRPADPTAGSGTETNTNATQASPTDVATDPSVAADQNPELLAQPAIDKAQKALQEYLKAHQNPVIEHTGADVCIKQVGQGAFELVVPYVSAQAQYEAHRKEIIDFMRKHFGWNGLQVGFTLAQNTTKKVEVLSDSEKFEKLVQQYPDMLELAKKFNLDFLN